MTDSEHSPNDEHSEYGGCVLVVDDDDQVRQMLCLALESASLGVIEASTQLEAHFQLARMRPDAVVLNLQRSVADGLDLLTRIRACHDLRAVPIVFLSGCENQEFRWQTLRAGADWYGVRPLGLRDLQNRVRGLIQQGRPRLKVIAGRTRGQALLGVRLRPAG
jgi:DNA-binding response OmpR family regulator